MLSIAIIKCSVNSFLEFEKKKKIQENFFMFFLVEFNFHT
jgi:hypothetical protein